MCPSSGVSISSPDFDTSGVYVDGVDTSFLISLISPTSFSSRLRGLWFWQPFTTSDFPPFCLEWPLWGFIIYLNRLSAVKPTTKLTIGISRTISHYQPKFHHSPPAARAASSSSSW